MKKFVLVATALFFSFSALVCADLTVGQSYPVNLTDVDGKKVSIADGHITTLILTSKSNVDKAHTVGDRIPDFCLGNPEYRMITVVAFQANHAQSVRAFLTSAARRRANSEGKQLQMRYDRLKIDQDARQAVVVVTDFDDAITTQFRTKWSSDLFRVFIFGKKGDLIKEWTDLPTTDELSAAMKQN